MKEKKMRAADIVILVISAAFCVAMLTVLHACGPMEDGSYMTCHWAEVSVKALAVLILVLEAVRLFTDRKVKAGISLAVCGIGILILLIPGRLIPLCMMSDMRCRAVMKPGATVFALLIAVLSAVDFAMGMRRE